MHTELPTAISRPDFQRHELGPVMHALGHEVFDMLEPEIPRIAGEGVLSVEQKGKQLTSISGINIFCVEVKQSVLEFVDNSLEGRGSDPSDSKPKATEPLQSVLDYYNSAVYNPAISTRSFTYYSIARLMLKEGFSSGIAVPVHLWRHIAHTETTTPDDTSGTEWLSRSQDINYMAKRIVEPTFQKMLHMLAYTHNGALGINSTDLTMINFANKSWAAWPALKDFLLDENGNVYDFTDEFKSSYFSRIKEANARWRKAHKDDIGGQRRDGSLRDAESGGCPVRHESFTKLGEVATEVLDSRPELKAYLERKESLIARSSRFLSSVLSQAGQIAAL